MSIDDWARARTTDDVAEPLTRETLDKAMAAMMKRGAEPRHDCRFDGHVAHFGTTSCVYCGSKIRDLTPDENRLLLGEFGD